MTEILNDRFLLRGGLKAALTALNEVPLRREMIIELDNLFTTGEFKAKIGDGSAHYNDLPYLQAGGATYTAGAGIDIDDTNPEAPIISCSLGSIALDGREDDYASLPTGLGTGDSGASYWVDADEQIYVWSGTAWPAQGAGISLPTSGGGSSMDIPDVGPDPFWDDVVALVIPAPHPQFRASIINKYFLSANPVPSFITKANSTWLFRGIDYYFQASADLTTYLDDLKANAFTLEAFIYVNDFASIDPGSNRPRVICFTASGSGFDRIWFGPRSTGKLSFGWYDGTNEIYCTSTASIPLNELVHISVSRNGTDIYLSINGVVEHFSAQNFNPPSVAVRPWIGQGANNKFPQFIGQAKITLGTARYTANFTPDADGNLSNYGE